MSAEGVIGVDVIVKIGTGATTAILGQRGAKMSAPRDLIDMSVKQNFPFKNKRPGWFDWSVDCDGLLMANGEGSFVSLVAKEIEGTEVDVVVTIANSGEQLAGKAFMTNVEMDAPQDKEGTMTCKLDGNGTLTPTEGV